ncbi:MAG: hypothetical protein KC442_24025 [Thermomicrobiales bacterium]|nr:hypothetical protein [Thermomicrobiales bacterium]
MNDTLGQTGAARICRLPGAAEEGKATSGLVARPWGSRIVTATPRRDPGGAAIAATSRGIVDEAPGARASRRTPWGSCSQKGPQCIAVAQPGRSPGMPLAPSRKPPARLRG